MKKLEYIIVQLLSLAGLEFGLFCALGWYWSCFEWSPFGYETCGLEGLVFWFFVWPSFLLAMLLKFGLLPRWKKNNLTNKLTNCKVLLYRLRLRYLIRARPLSGFLFY